MKNPYSLVFGKEPIQSISRSAQMTDILPLFEDYVIANYFL